MNQTTASTEEEDVTSSSWALEDEYLPNDVALYIASMLQVPELCALGSCSVFWRRLCASDLIWVSLSKERWPALNLFGDSIHKKEENSKQSENAGNCDHPKLVLERANYKHHADFLPRALT